MFLWDAERATAVTDFSRDPSFLPQESTLVTDMDGQKESAYALAMDVGGDVLVSGYVYFCSYFPNSRVGDKAIGLTCLLTLITGAPGT